MVNTVFLWTGSLALSVMSRTATKVDSMGGNSPEVVVVLI
jgi:hypothetical protein